MGIRGPKVVAATAACALVVAGLALTPAASGKQKCNTKKFKYIVHITHTADDTTDYDDTRVYPGTITISLKRAIHFADVEIVARKCEKGISTIRGTRDVVSANPQFNAWEGRDDREDPPPNPPSLGSGPCGIDFNVPIPNHKLEVNGLRKSADATGWEFSIHTSADEALRVAHTDAVASGLEQDCPGRHTRTSSAIDRPTPAISVGGLDVDTGYPMKDFDRYNVYRVSDGNYNAPAPDVLEKLLKGEDGSLTATGSHSVNLETIRETSFKIDFSRVRNK